MGKNSINIIPQGYIVTYSIINQIVQITKEYNQWQKVLAETEQMLSLHSRGGGGVQINKLKR